MTQEAQPTPQTIIHISVLFTKGSSQILESGKLVLKERKMHFTRWLCKMTRYDNFDDHVFVHSFIQRILRVYLRQIIQICSELITNVLDVTL